MSEQAAVITSRDPKNREEIAAKPGGSSPTPDHDPEFDRIHAKMEQFHSEDPEFDRIHAKMEQFHSELRPKLELEKKKK